MPAPRPRCAFLRSKSWVEKVESIERMNAVGKRGHEESDEQADRAIGELIW
jgi:hypothetical protein